VHGNGGSTSIWQSTVRRLGSNGWPCKRLHAIELPYPLTQDNDGTPQPDRTATAERMESLKAEVEKVMKTIGAQQVVLMAKSRGGHAVRNRTHNGGGDKNREPHGAGQPVQPRRLGHPGFRKFNGFSSTRPFLTALNTPKNAAGDEVTSPVRAMTLRCDNNDKSAQPDGLWIGAKGNPTKVTFTDLGLVSSDPVSGDQANNLPLPDAQLVLHTPPTPPPVSTRAQRRTTRRWGLTVCGAPSPRRLAYAVGS
jgi:hypothetical protein